MNKEQHSIALMCRAYGVSRDGFNSWRRRGESLRSSEDSELFSLIARIFKKHDGCYGSPKITHILRSMGHCVGQKRVARLMREYGLKAVKACIYPPKKNINGFAKASPNRIVNMPIERLNQVWVGDITYIKLANGVWQYLSVIMDRFSRRIIAWALSDRRDAGLSVRTIDRAIKNRGYSSGVIFHSDKGSEYIATAFRERLASYDIEQSMNRVKEMNDNAFMESFFNSLKLERIKRQVIETAEQLKNIVSHYMRYYNHERIHMSIGGVSPVTYERELNY
jgi:transposase InsO family protein